MIDPNKIEIFIDADGCPVKEEVYRVATRYQLKVFIVANKWMKTPLGNIEMIVVPGNFDAADDWIVENAKENDIVITADILLADRCLKKSTQIRVLGHKGKEFTDDNIGEMVASRELMNNLRQMGEISGGPKPHESKDRSVFLQKLDQIIQTLKK